MINKYSCRTTHKPNWIRKNPDKTIFPCTMIYTWYTYMYIYKYNIMQLQNLKYKISYSQSFGSHYIKSIQIREAHSSRTWIIKVKIAKIWELNYRTMQNENTWTYKPIPLNSYPQACGLSSVFGVWIIAWCTCWTCRFIWPWLHCHC